MLDQIFDFKRQEVERAKQALSLQDLKSKSKDLPATKGLHDALVQFKHDTSHISKGTASLGLIAEVKKASPSQGLIRPDFDPVSIAHSYANAGAQCLSVLTDERYFQGSAEYLTQIRMEVDLPILCKDFIYDPYQIYQARTWGADAILLIAAAMSISEMVNLFALARELNLDVLIESHDEEDVQKALAVGGNLMGVNNRNLSNFKTDISTSENLLPILKAGSKGNDLILVSESALDEPQDVLRVQQAGADAVLIGTAFCRHSDIEKQVHKIMER